MAFSGGRLPGSLTPSLAPSLERSSIPRSLLPRTLLPHTPLLSGGQMPGQAKGKLRTKSKCFGLDKLEVSKGRKEWEQRN